MKTVKVIRVGEGRTVAGGWDADVIVGGVAGSVTLLPADYDGSPRVWGRARNQGGDPVLGPADYDGSPRMWGSPDWWLSASLLGLTTSEMDDVEEAVATEIVRRQLEPGRCL